MKNQKIKIFRRYWQIVFCCLFTISAFGQISVDQWRDILVNNKCNEVTDVIDTISTQGEGLTYYVARCLFNNSNYLRSQELFSSIHSPESQRYTNISYWLTRCALNLSHIEKAESLFLTIPLESLSPEMLSPEEFKLFEGKSFYESAKNQIYPSFNFWTILSLIISILGFLLSVFFLVGNSSSSKGQKWMALTMFCYASILLIYVLIWTRYSNNFPGIHNVWLYFIYLIGPSIYFYLASTFEVSIDLKKVLKHFAFPIIMCLIMLPYVTRSFVISFSLAHDLLSIGSSSNLMIAHLLYYSFLVHNLINNDWQVDTNIKRWSKIVSSGLTLYTLAFISYFVLSTTSFFSPQWDYLISLVMSASILTVGYMAILQKKIFASESMDNFLPISKYKSSSLTSSASKSIMAKLEQLLKEEKVFRENELRLDDLAEYLNINRHQLSQVINENYGINFFELINSFRVEHTKVLLSNPKNDHLTISQIAFESGFNNKASFNRYFKKAVGLTPSAFRIKVNNEYVR